jgi:hypothetical protein
MRLSRYFAFLRGCIEFFFLQINANYAAHGKLSALRGCMAA